MRASQSPARSSPAPPETGQPVPARGAGFEVDWIFARSLRMRPVWDMVERVAPTDATVLITGESGVGKEVVARTLHLKSPRRDRPFVKVNCAALPAELLESELLGYERGAFTGAHRPKPGKFELAHGGTIFLDEVGELPIHLQAKLLQVLQDREFSPLGSTRDVRVDIRVIAATNRDLAERVQRGEFRDDLYYRLNVMSIFVPPLRDRRDEIPQLVEHFLQKYAAQYGRPEPRLSPETWRVFMEYAWPGNIRELENCLKRIVLLESEDFVAALVNGAPQRPSVAVTPALPVAPSRPVWDAQLGLKEIARRAAHEAEGLALREVLDQVRWHRVEAARRLKVSYKTLLQKMKQHGLGLALAVAGALSARV